MAFTRRDTIEYLRRVNKRRARITANVVEVLSHLLPDGLLESNKAQLRDTTFLTQTSGTSTLNDDSFTMQPSSRVSTTELGALTGNYWVSTIASGNAGSGTYRPRFLSPTYMPNSTRQRVGPQVWKFPSIVGSTMLDFVTGSTAVDLEFEAIQVVEMASVLADPCDVYVAMGQSLMASSTQSVGTDNYQDSWTDKRALYIPGRTYSQFGAVRGEIQGLSVPLQHGSDTDSTAYCTGVSPAHQFGVEMVKSVASGRNVLIIAAAISGTGLTASDAPWNSDGTDPYAYDNAVALVNAAMSSLPSGSVIKGCLWAQGEADISADMSGYPAAFAAMRSDFETAVNSGVQLPWIIITAPPNGTNTHQAHFIDTQTKMDADSGHAYSQTNVYAVARETAIIDDGTHPDAENQRKAGKAAAARFKQIGV